MDRHLSKARVGNETDQQGEADRLSELPDALIVQILSKLEMKDSVKTGILSKRWENLWTQVDRIVYKFRILKGDSEEEYHRKLLKFISFVDRSLMKCTCPTIRKFSLGGCFHWDLENDGDDNSVSKLLDKWLSFLVNKKVENLKLILGNIMYTAPDCLYRNSSLVKLKLGFMCLTVSFPVSWSLLKKLDLFGMWLFDESISNILMGSPVLETIEICCVPGINQLDIMSPSVKKLVVRQFEYEDVEMDDYLYINAPWLEELEITDSFLVPQCELVNIASLKKATFAFAYSCHPDEDKFYDRSTGNPFDIWWNDMVFKLSKSLHEVDDITLGTEIIQALAVAKLRGASYPMFKCKHLTITSPIWKNDIYPIACLLQTMPYLESLSIKVSSWEHYYIMAHTMPFANDDFQSRSLHMNLPEGKLIRLKSVKIEYIIEGVQKPLESFDFELVAYILRNASILEKILLLTSGGKDCSDHCPSYCACQKAPCLSAKLLSTRMVWNKTLALELLRKRKTDSVIEFGVLNCGAPLVFIN